MLELLVNAGSDINAQNIVGDAPLHKAALNGRARSADFLIRAGANVNIRNEFAQTPLHAACVSGNIEVVQRLVQGGADTSAQDAAEVSKQGTKQQGKTKPNPGVWSLLPETRGPQPVSSQCSRFRHGERGEEDVSSAQHMHIDRQSERSTPEGFLCFRLGSGVNLCGRFCPSVFN